MSADIITAAPYAIKGSLNDFASLTSMGRIIFTPLF